MQQIAVKENSTNNGSQEHRAKSSLWRSLASVRLTVFLLISLAVASVIGTIIPQNEAPSVYVRQYGDTAYQVLNRLQVFDMYHSVWFVLLLVSLTTNLLICSINRFSSTWYVVRRKNIKPSDSLFNSLPQRGTLVTKRSLDDVREICQRCLTARFKTPIATENQGTWYLFSDRGRYTRLGVYVVHLSVILILIGGLLGLLFGFRGSVSIPEGGTANRIFLPNNLQGRELGFAIRCEDFDVSYYDTGQPKEYKSVISVLENGNEVMKKTIRVNHPFSYRGLTFYQSSFGIDSLNKIKLHIRPANGNEEYTLDVPFGRWTKVPEGNSAFQVMDFNENLMRFGPAIKICYGKPGTTPIFFWVLKSYPDFDVGRKGEYIFSLVNYQGRYYTGLSVTKDPGVWVVWIGSSLMVLAFIVVFFMSHQTVWVKIESVDNGVRLKIGGRTYKNVVPFERRFKRLWESIREEAK
jgi:cytochrome c biogenesis protein